MIGDDEKKAEEADTKAEAPAEAPPAPATETHHLKAEDLEPEDLEIGDDEEQPKTGDAV